MLYARRKGLEVDVRHESRPAGGGRPRIAMTLGLGGELAAEQAARVRDVAARCPMHRMLADGTDVVEEDSPGETTGPPAGGRGGYRVTGTPPDA
ncbi:MAG: OsmC family protein, partial [Candidatus Rokuibacteriota bacterium]